MSEQHADNTRYYASKLRRLIWVTLSISFAVATGYYVLRGWTIAVIICAIWTLLAVSWSITLLTKPVVEFTTEQINIMQNVVFGYPTYLHLSQQDITGIGRSSKTHLEIFSRQISPCIIVLKLLAPADRQRFKQSLLQISAAM